MLKQKGYKYFTKIDLSMMLYCFELDEPSKELCTIVTPFGKFQYNRLPMGVKFSPDVAQSLIKKILTDLDVEVYIDDIGIWTKGSFQEHLAIIDEVLNRLQKGGMKCNPLKCEWLIKESDFLGFWMTPTGVKPMKKKIEAVLKMGQPQNQTQVRALLHAVTFYRSLWPQQSHGLAPLHMYLQGQELSYGRKGIQIIERNESNSSSRCYECLSRSQSSF